MAEQLIFDKLTYMDRLTRAGISEEQARAQAEALHEALRESVATQSFVREEIAATQSFVRQEITAAQSLVRQEIAAVRQDTVALEQRLTIRGGVVAAAMVAILASLKFFG